MKQDAAPAVVRDEEKPREEKRSEESAAAAFPEPAVVEDEEKQESEDGSAEEVAQPTLETFHSPEVSDAEEETREDAKDLPTQVEESRKLPQDPPQQTPIRRKLTSQAVEINRGPPLVKKRKEEMYSKIIETSPLMWMSQVSEIHKRRSPPGKSKLSF
jgi:hypothetical protein